MSNQIQFSIQIQMEIPSSNFFQVTINSKKLFAFIKDLQSQLLHLREEIKEMNGKLSMQMSSNQTIKNKHEDLVLNLELMKKRNAEDYNHFKLYLQDFDNKNCQKFNQFSECNTILSKKLASVKNQMQEDFAAKISYLQHKFQNQNALAKVEQTFKQQFTVMKDFVEKVNQVHQKVQQKLAEEIKINQEKNSMLLKKFQTIQPAQQGIKTIHHIQTSFQQMPDHSGISLSKSRKKIKFDPACSIKNINPDSGTVGLKPKEALRMVINKLEHITSEFDKKIPQLQQKIKKYMVKSEIVQEQIDIFNRKLERQKAQINLINEQIKRLQQKKVSQKIIDGIRVTISQLMKQLDQKAASTLTRQIFQKQSSRVNKELLQLTEICAEKAQKSDVKRGLTFLQSKIKDIVIVLAEQRNFINNGAIKRIPFKCLSCDKELQNNNDSSSNQRNIRCSINLPVRNSTPHLRKRTKMQQAFSTEQN